MAEATAVSASRQRCAAAVGHLHSTTWTTSAQTLSDMCSCVSMHYCAVATLVGSRQHSLAARMAFEKPPAMLHVST